MSSEVVQIIEFGGKPIRVFEREGKRWHSTRDFCEAIGVSKYRDAHRKVDEAERTVLAVSPENGRKMQALTMTGVFVLLTRVRTKSVDVAQVRAALAGKLASEASPAATEQIATTKPAEPTITVRAVADDPTPSTLTIDLRDPAQLATVAAQLLAMLGEAKAETARAVDASEAIEAKATPALALSRRIESAVGEFGFRQTAKLLKVKETSLAQLMVSSGFAYRLNGILTASAWSLDRKLAVQRVLMVADREGTAHARPTLRVTGKGISWLAAKVEPSPRADVKALEAPGQLALARGQR